jgi:cytochrome c oxidase assembly protein subunit 15
MSLAPDAQEMNAQEAAAGGRSRARQTRRWLLIWLGCVAVLLVGMIVLGGATRLTQSGLSITEWRPVTGAVPPLSEEAWQAEFEKYQRIPQYQALNPDISLADFKIIYWWEWSHRLLGRVIGAAVFVPLAFFVLARRIGPKLTRRLIFILLLGAAQGALGWYMVQSGLSERISVSQYRLAAHLGLAFIIYGAVLATIFDLVWAEPMPQRQIGSMYLATIGFVALVFVQILMGAFMAGTHAGLTDNTWPLIDGRLVPKGLSALEPWTRNLFENVTTIQFVHRVLAYLVLLSATLLWHQARRAARARNVPELSTAANILLGTVVVQLALGIATLVLVVPLPLALLHQLGAVAVLSATLAMYKAAGIPAHRTVSA